MAHDLTITGFTVTPIDDGADRLIALTIQPTTTTSRIAANGAVLTYGDPQPTGDPIVVPAHQIADLTRELADWPVYYATGRAHADKR